MIPMPLYAILRFQKCKAGGVACRDRHNERKKVEYKSNPNIDLTRSRDNYHLIEPKGRYKDAYTRMIGKAGCKVRSNSTVLVETLVTASPELLNRMTPKEQRQFFERAATFLYERIGKENVISAVVHMDEKTPHMHLCFCPITKDGRLSAKDILGNKQALSKWQDDFFSWMAQAYPALSRGIPSYVTHRKHIPPYQFRMAKDLSKSYGRLEEALQTVTVFNAGKKREEALGIIGELLPACYKLAGQLQSTEAYIKEHDLEIVDDKSLIEETIAAVIAENPKAVEQYKSGQTKICGFFVGQTMKRLKGKADPAAVNAVLAEALKKL